jgi:hypothetical protein
LHHVGFHGHPRGGLSRSFRSSGWVEEGQLLEPGSVGRSAPFRGGCTGAGGNTRLDGQTLETQLRLKAFDHRGRLPAGSSEALPSPITAPQAVMGIRIWFCPPNTSP